MYVNAVSRRNGVKLLRYTTLVVFSYTCSVMNCLFFKVLLLVTESFFDKVTILLLRYFCVTFYILFVTFHIAIFDRCQSALSHEGGILI